MTTPADPTTTLPPPSGLLGAGMPVNTQAGPDASAQTLMPWQQQIQVPTAPVAMNPSTTLAPTAVVDPMLVSNQVNALTAENSPIMQRAAAVANESSNDRGLLNSSMAVGAAQNAVLGAAIPIAQSDVNAYNATELANAQQLNAMNTAQGQLSQQSNLANTQAINANIMAGLDQANKLQLSGIQTQYQSFLNANSNASTLYSNTLQSISQIQNNPNMDSATKTTAIQQAIAMLSQGLNMFSAINGLNLGAGLNFGSGAGNSGLAAQGGGAGYPAQPTANGDFMGWASSIFPRGVPISQANPVWLSAAYDWWKAASPATRAAAAGTTGMWPSFGNPYSPGNNPLPVTGTAIVNGNTVWHPVYHR